jgi:hypothetical protein
MNIAPQRLRNTDSFAKIADQMSQQQTSFLFLFDAAPPAMAAGVWLRGQTIAKCHQIACHRS